MAHREQDHVDGWITYSEWVDNLRDNSQIISENYDNNATFKQQLLACQSNEDRFKLIWNDKRLLNELEKVYRLDTDACKRKSNSRLSKSKEESKGRRELGNKSFKEGNYTEALNQYTQAVVYAPYPSQIANGGCGDGDKNDANHDDESLALALANRSAALYSLTRYRLCLLDIELAIKYGYPEANMFKLLIRKIKCLHILSVWANDVEQIKADLKSMLKKSDVKDYVKFEISNMFEFLDSTQPEDMEKDELDVVDESIMKISNTSKTLSQAADCVEMSYDSDQGRYLLTNKCVSYGRLLLAEEPYVCVLAPDKRDQYCYHCFGKLHSCGIGCSNCTQILYCSESCRTANHDTHTYECNGFLDYQEKIGVAYTVALIMFKIKFDLSTILIYNRKSAEKKSLDEVLQVSPADWPDMVFKNDYASVLSLMDHAEDYDYDEIMGLALTAAYLMIGFLDHFAGSNEILKDEKQQLTTGSVILRHLMQLQTNLISILDQDFQNLTSVGHSLSNIKERPVGVGIYPTISLLNHSCSPNILSVFHRNRFLARAAKSLDCGTEINYCYGPSVTRMSKKDRQKRLQEQYFFLCECECCTSGKENESRALLCPSCTGPIIYNQDMTHKCLKCHKENIIDARNSIKTLSTIHTQLERVKLSQSDYQEKLESLQDLEKKLSKLAYWRHPLFVQLKTELIESAEGLGDIDLALKFCHEELDLCSRTHGPDSYESIMTKLKLINYKWQSVYYRIESMPTDQEKVEAIEELDQLIATAKEITVELKDLLASTNIMGAESSYETELKFLADLQTSINAYKSSLTLEAEDNVPESKESNDK